MRLERCEIVQRSALLLIKKRPMENYEQLRIITNEKYKWIEIQKYQSEALVRNPRLMPKHLIYVNFVMKEKEKLL